LQEELDAANRKLRELERQHGNMGSPHDLLKIARYRVMLMNRYLWARF
jgi:hypothetical protein